MRNTDSCQQAFTEHIQLSWCFGECSRTADEVLTPLCHAIYSTGFGCYFRYDLLSPQSPSLSCQLWGQPLDYYPLLLFTVLNPQPGRFLVLVPNLSFWETTLYIQVKKYPKYLKRDQCNFQNSLLCSIDKNRKSEKNFFSKMHESILQNNLVLSLDPAALFPLGQKWV